MPEELKQTDDFVFDPNLMDLEEGSGQEDQKPNEEKLNLLNDTIFDSDKTDEDKTVDDEVDPDKGNKDDTPSPDETKGDDAPSKSVFSVVLGQDLMDRGVLSSFNEEEISKISKEEGEPAAIMAMMEAQTKATQEELMSKYDSGYQEYQQMLQGGVSKEEATGIKQLENFANSFKDIDLKSEDEAAATARKDLLTVNYRLTTKWSEAKIQKHVEKLYDSGEDLDEIEEAKENLQGHIDSEKVNATNRAQAEGEKLKADRLALETSYKNQISKADEFFEGEKINKEVKDKMEKLIFTPVKNANGSVTNQLWANRDKDPTSFDTKLAYLVSIGYFEDKPLGKFVKSATTKATSGLDNFLNDNKGRSFMNSRKGSFSSETAGKKDFLDF